MAQHQELEERKSANALVDFPQAYLCDTGLRQRVRGALGGTPSRSIRIAPTLAVLIVAAAFVFIPQGKAKPPSADITVSEEADVSVPQDPTRGITAALSEFHRALRTKDIEAMVARFSDDFSNSQGADKSVMRGYFESVVAQGMYHGLAVDMGECEITADGDSATVAPVTYESPIGGKWHNSYTMK